MPIQKRIAYEGKRREPSERETHAAVPVAVELEDVSTGLLGAGRDLRCAREAGRNSRHLGSKHPPSSVGRGEKRNGCGEDEVQVGDEREADNDAERRRT